MFFAGAMANHPANAAAAIPAAAHVVCTGIPA